MFSSTFTKTSNRAGRTTVTLTAVLSTLQQQDQRDAGESPASVAVDASSERGDLVVFSCGHCFARQVSFDFLFSLFFFLFPKRLALLAQSFFFFFKHCLLHKLSDLRVRRVSFYACFFPKA